MENVQSWGTAAFTIFKSSASVKSFLRIAAITSAAEKELRGGVEALGTLGVVIGFVSFFIRLDERRSVGSQS